jgi:hypothetical protein
MSPTVVDDLAYVREFTGLTGSELAELFHTSTEEMQDWLRGGEVPSAITERVHAVAAFVRRTPANPTNLAAERYARAAARAPGTISAPGGRRR